MRHRRIVRVLNRLLDRGDLQNTLPPSYQQLRNDSLIFLPKLRGYCLQMSVNLQRSRRPGVSARAAAQRTVRHASGAALRRSPRAGIATNRNPSGHRREGGSGYLPRHGDRARRSRAAGLHSSRCRRSALPLGHLCRRGGCAALCIGVAEVSLLGSGSHAMPGVRRVLFSADA